MLRRSLRNRPYFPAIFLALFVGSAALLYFFNASFQIYPSVLGAIAAFGYFHYRQHLDETKLLKELFVEFNARYSELQPTLDGIMQGPFEGVFSPEERVAVMKYFNLCAEEYYFKKSGYIPEEIWKAWCDGMAVYFSHARISRAWADESAPTSFYGFIPPPVAPKNTQKR